jgi:hypothetical protein
MSMLPLMGAAALSIVRAERLDILPACALVASSIVFFGSHILTVLWGSTVLVLMCVTIVILIPSVRRGVRARRLIRVPAVVLPALLVNAWFLLPTAAYASHTRIGSRYGVAYNTLRATMRLVTFDHLFALSRATTVPGYPDYVLSLPTVTIVWVLVSMAMLLWSVRRGIWLRMLVIFALLTTGMVVLMTHLGLLLALPKPYTLLQFSYRLEGYVLMGVTAAVIVILVVVRSGGNRLQRWSWTIVPVLAVSLFGAVQQLDAYPRTEVSRGVALTSTAEIFAQRYIDYTYALLPFVSERGLPKLSISPAEVHGNNASLTVHARPGQLIATNIGGGPDLLRIAGAGIAGIDERAQLVLAIGTTASKGAIKPHTPVSTEHISISQAERLPVVLGRLLALAGVVMLLVIFAVLSVRNHRNKGGRR